MKWDPWTIAVCIGMSKSHLQALGATDAFSTDTYTPITTTSSPHPQKQSSLQDYASLSGGVLLI